MVATSESIITAQVEGGRAADTPSNFRQSRFGLIENKSNSDERDEVNDEEEGTSKVS